ncbi:MAG: carboxylesterase family protein [Myxococcales bacterium]|nr:carboxylesterase family protein [Myxococcales bacterium]
MRSFSLLVVVGLAGCGGVAVPDGGVEVDAPPVDGGATLDGGADAGVCGDGITLGEGVVLTTGGAISGQLTGDVTSFMGVPYAKPPVGALRWRSPEPIGCQAGVQQALAAGPICPQQLADGGVVGDENCLTVNVFAKRGVSGAPVMVWIHGGGNVQGSGSAPLYDGRDLAARHGAVVVTMNYRLGALGFFAHAGLSAESDAGVSGNYGLLDQQLALRWVRDNARAFGGDPARVLLFGESAGGQNTMLHLVAPGSKGLFSAAIAQSGGVYSTTLSEAVTSLQPVVQTTGCAAAANQVDCLRAVSATSLTAIESALGPLEKTGLRYGPVIDGVVVPDHPMTLIRQGKQHGVPVILGTNADETSRMVPLVRTDAEYRAAVTAQYGAALANRVLVQYPSARFSSPRVALIALTTDATWTCPTRRLARALESTQPAPVYRYFFTWRAPGPAGAVVGSTHGLEIPFIFRTFGALTGTAPDAAALSLSDAMQASWVSFASTGVPTSPVVWPRLPSGGDAALELGTPIAAMTGVRTADCDFIDSLVP